MEESGLHFRYNLIVIMFLLVAWTSGNDTPVHTGAIMESDGTTTASSFQNTSLEFTQDQSSSATNCILTIPTEKKGDVEDRMGEVFQDNAVFIYFKLIFSGLQDVYENSSDIIEPTTWVWALEGKGELLLSYPFDFEQLSLGTLSLGVVNIEVPVNTPADDCFQKAKDDDKERILARFVNSVIQSTNDTLNITKKEFYRDKGATVCLEKQRSDDFDLVGVYGFPLCTYYVIQGSTLYECWAGDRNPFEITSILIRKHDWLTVILVLGLVMALFSPLVGSFFIRKQELIEKDGKEYIALNADLPLGLKYLLCFSCQEYELVVAARWFIYVVAFMIIPFIPFIISYIVSGEAFFHRLEVAYELLLSKALVIFWFIFVNTIFLTIAMLFLGLYLYDDLFSLEVKDEDRVDFGLIIPLTENLYVPKKPSSPKTAFSTFMYTMRYRTSMAINPALWSYWFSPIWNFTFGLLGGVNREENSKCLFFATFLIFIIVFPFALILFCFILLFNSVPLFYMVTWTVAKCTSKKINAVEIFVAFSAMILSFAVIFIFVAAFVYVAELIGYTFIGFVLNSDFAGPVVVVIITVVGYLVTAATNFYDKYCVLLKRIIEKAEEVDKENSKKPSGNTESRPVSENEGEISDMETTDHETIELQSSGAVSTNMLVKYENGVPIVPFHLFKLVIKKYQPVYLEVAGIVFQLLIIAIVVAFGLTTIIFIDGVSDLPATVEFFATVVVAGFVPLLMLILKSPGKLENDDEVKARHLEADLEYYAEKETFEKMFL